MGKLIRIHVFLLLAALPSQACTLVGGPSGPPSPAAPGASPAAWTETGVASWYGEPFHGRTTASGETYDMNDLTCAHRTLPFGTRLHVRNLENGRTVVVRVNDRGPFAKDRIVDLSRRAARELEMIGPGTARVRITVLPDDQRTAAPADSTPPG
jgi:rare lipoprotein A